MSEDMIEQYIKDQYTATAVSLSKSYGFVVSDIGKVIDLFRSVRHEKMGRLLSLGSGDGRVENIAARLFGFNVMGIELSPQLVQIARDHTEALDEVVQHTGIKTKDGTIEFVTGNYFPIHFRKKVQADGLTTFIEGHDPYTNFKIADFDFVYVYP